MSAGPRDTTSGSSLNSDAPPQIHGDAVAGDKTDNRVTAGDIAGSTGVAIGPGARAETTIIQQVSPASEPLPSLHALPPPYPDFTGREAELAELRAAVKPSGVTVLGLLGPGGVGKTALALKLADELSARYPDAELYLNLRGGRRGALKVAQVAGHVIRAYHPKAALPKTESELLALYRTVLSGQRALLLLDNAREAAQVLPLIPPPGCLLLVTSRRHFSLPGMHAQVLDCLPPADAEAFLRKVAGRVGGEAAEIAKLCGYLPLALRLAGSALAEHEDLTPAAYVRRLQRAQTRFEPVDASLSLSDNLLAPELRRRWRRLAVFPATFDRAAAAAVWDLSDMDEAQDALSDLVQSSLVEWDKKWGLYHLHDLARLFAAQPDPRPRALRRLRSRLTRHELSLPERRTAALWLTHFQWLKDQEAKPDELLAYLGLIAGYLISPGEREILIRRITKQLAPSGTRLTKALRGGLLVRRAALLGELGKIDQADHDYQLARPLVSKGTEFAALLNLGLGNNCRRRAEATEAPGERSQLLGQAVDYYQAAALAAQSAGRVQIESFAYQEWNSALSLIPDWEGAETCAQQAVEVIAAGQRALDDQDFAMAYTDALSVASDFYLNYARHWQAQAQPERAQENYRAAHRLALKVLSFLRCSPWKWEVGGLVYAHLNAGDAIAGLGPLAPPQRRAALGQHALAHWRCGKEFALRLGMDDMVAEADARLKENPDR